ncbi:MAG: hypothetical protein B7Y97_02430 [Sphingomonas sp. 32-66-10]|nr:MAG: hypothetical protein B7Y97_02430 [Sphingomonas sp. 32-66-10]
MIARSASTLVLVSLTAALAACSTTTTVHARIVDGQIAFVGLEREIGCIYNIEVREQDSGSLVWQLDYVSGKCLGNDPHFYGAAPRGAQTVVSPEKLRLGVAYEVSGTAEGANYFGGAFRVTRDTVYRIEDLPLRSVDLMETLLPPAPPPAP